MAMTLCSRAAAPVNPMTNRNERLCPPGGAWPAGRFAAARARLRAVAYRPLGPVSGADDAVREAWLRLSRADTGAVEHLSG